MYVYMRVCACDACACVGMCEGVYVITASLHKTITYHHPRIVRVSQPASEGQQAATVHIMHVHMPAESKDTPCSKHTDKGDSTLASRGAGGHMQNQPALNHTVNHSRHATLLCTDQILLYSASNSFNLSSTCSSSLPGAQQSPHTISYRASRRTPGPREAV
jgi:hypothetical protein